MALVKAGVVAIGPGSPSAFGGAGLFTPEIVNTSQAGLLIAHLRRTIKATLPEIVEAPDTLFAMPTDAEGFLATPFLAILAHTPRSADSAVNDTTQSIPIDFVYVHKNVVPGIPDVQAYERDRLLQLQRALIADYRQGGAANATRVANTAIDHLNEYQKQLSEDTQPLAVLVLTMEFDVIEARAI